MTVLSFLAGFISESGAFLLTVVFIFMGAFLGKTSYKMLLHMYTVRRLRKKYKVSKEDRRKNPWTL